MSTRRNSLMLLPEISLIFEDIRTKPDDVKEKASIELRSVFSKYTEQSEEILTRLQKYINSSDLSEKMGGLIAVEHLVPVIQETQQIQFINKFHSVVFQQFSLNTEPKIIKKTADVFGKLIRMGGTKLSQVVLADLEDVLKWIKGDSNREMKKYAAILALKELLVEAPILSSTKIPVDKFFQPIWSLVRDRKPNLREAALSFIDVCIKQISQREYNLQKDWADQILYEIDKCKNSTDPDIIHGNINSLRSLLKYFRKELFEKGSFDITEYIFAHRNDRQLVQISVIQTIPVIAAFNPEFFIQKNLKTSILFLLDVGKTAKDPKLKSVCYFNLAKLIDLLEQSALDPYLGDILLTLTNELDKRIKPPCLEIIKCYHSLRHKFKKKILSLIDINQLVDNILINGLYPQSLDLLTEITKLDSKENESAEIELKLLNVISFILQGEIYHFKEKYLADIPISQKSISGFQRTLIQETQIDRSPNSIAQSLQALTNFRFVHFAKVMPVLFRDVVLEFFDNSNPTIRKAAAKAGCLLYNKQIAESTHDSIGKIIVLEILDKFLCVAFNDPDDEVRETMLNSLNEDFDEFLNHERYLQMLFMCINDSVYSVKEKALQIIARLTKRNPSDIVPFLKEQILEILDDLKAENVFKEKEKIQKISFLTTFIGNAESVILPHTETISVSLLRILNDRTTSNTLFPYLLEATKVLASKVQLKFIPYLNDFFPIILQCMQDTSYSAKREVAVKTMVQIIKSTGFVIAPYYKYPYLMEVLLMSIRLEANLNIRREMLTLLGALGAIDGFYYKKVKNKLHEGLARSSEEIIAHHFKTSFSILKYLKETRQILYKPIVDLHKYYDEILVMYNLNRKNISAELNKEKAITYFGETADKFLAQKALSSNKQTEEIDLLLNAPDQINLGSMDYYSTVAIKTVLRVLWNSSLQQHHNLSLGALSFIMNSLRSRLANFVYLIMPVFCQIIQNSDLSIKELILQNIEKTLVLCGEKFPEEYIDSVIQVVLSHIDLEELRLVMRSFEILNSLIISCRKHLKHKMEIIIAKLNQILIELEGHKAIIVWVIKIFNNSGNLLDPHLSKVISLLSRMVQQNPTFQEREVLVQVVTFFSIIVHTCTSAIKFCSKIVHTLFFIMDHYSDSHQVIIDSFILMLYKYRDLFLVYLPLLNLRVIKLKIVHERYREYLSELLHNGDFDACEPISGQELSENYYSTATSFSVKVAKNTMDSLNKCMSGSVVSSKPPPALTIRKDIDFKALIQEFQTSNRVLEGDWQEWYRKSSLELLKQSPYHVLYGCNSFAELFNNNLIAKELYNVAFVSCWSILPQKESETIAKELKVAISAKNMPVNILTRILSLFEFTEHDRGGVQLEISELGELAEKSQAFAKALYYREQEFEDNPRKAINSLISLYSLLGHSDAAHGMLVYAIDQLKMEPKMSWYVNLQRWEEALKAFEDHPVKENNPGMLIDKIKCLYNLSEWELVLADTEKLFSENSQSDDEKLKSVAYMAADASLHLNEWKKFENYVEKTESTDDKSYLNSLLYLKQGKYDEARYFINKAKSVLDTKVMGLLLESYNRAYEAVLRLQKLVEMEEIMEYKEAESKILAEMNYLEGDDDTEADDEEANGIMNKSLMITSLNSPNQTKGVSRQLINLKANLISKWNDRLNGCQRSVDVWQKVLAIRSILFDRAENLDCWIRFVHLCRKTNESHNVKLARRTLKAIEDDLAKHYPDKKKYPPKFVLASLECEYLYGEVQLSETIEKIQSYLKLDTWKDWQLKSKYYYKLGKLSRVQYNDQVFDSMPWELEYYKKSLECNDKNYKAWHSYGYVHFEVVEYFESRNKKNETLVQYIKSALDGFIKALSLGGIQSSTSRTLQDLLRFLTLWFNYGDNDEVLAKIQESFDKIELISWIDVVPQLMARFDIPKTNIRNSIHTLLMRIGKQHPQALVYPLTVASQDKDVMRSDAARVIIRDIEKHSKSLIDQALLIAGELNRTAIILKEQWYDGIERASQNYFHENNIKQMIKTLMELTTHVHTLLKKGPETLSEMSFCQSFGLEIIEAGQWLKRYEQRSQDLTSINQAWEIYSTLFHKIKDRLNKIAYVYLENVSPKLIQFKDGEISVPGMYRPNKPVVALSGFAPRLPVLASKQHPRKLFIYGSDGKEYTFLLKGKEDLRQDERVMQLFSLCNKLLTSEPITSKKDLSITRYAIIPISQGAGLCGWVQNCDTLLSLVQEYRQNARIYIDAERQACAEICDKFDSLPVANKVELYLTVLENTRGQDIKNALWLNSPNSETWLERRTTFTKSLATMSIVGYILGLGDRHPGNIMIQRQTGQIVHIDFGDCFEVAMKRERFPEKVPFRLTRMLVNAMEAGSIEGTFTSTCDSVMTVLRENKESLIAILQAFVYDPLLNWRLLTDTDDDTQTATMGQADQTTMTFISGGLQMPLKAMERVKGAEELKDLVEPKKDEEEKVVRRGTIRKTMLEIRESNSTENEQEANEEDKKEEIEKEKKILDEARTALEQMRAKKARMAEDVKARPEILNKKALEVVDRIKKKLAGREFPDAESLTVVGQVRRLISEARSAQNLSQAYIGWCPYW